VERCVRRLGAVRRTHHDPRVDSCLLVTTEPDDAPLQMAHEEALSRTPGTKYPDGQRRYGARRGHEERESIHAAIDPKEIFLGIDIRAEGREWDWRCAIGVAAPVRALVRKTRRHFRAERPRPFASIYVESREVFQVPVLENRIGRHYMASVEHR